MRGDGPISARVLIAGGAGLGLLMAGAAVGWIALLRQRSLGALFPPAPWGALAVGGLAGAAFAAAVWAAFRRTALLHNEVAVIDRLLDLRALRWYHVVAIALLAAVPEELLFRGALLPEVGVIVSAALFGLAHAVSWQYVVYAGLAGLLCGALAEWTGGLWAPIAAHAVIDMMMFALLILMRPPGGWAAPGGAVDRD
ncbi:MAG: hypothetical protein Kow00120_15310 [Anaerolineae bacterium]